MSAGVIGAMVGAVIGGAAAALLGWTAGWDDACDTMTKILADMDDRDLIYVSLVRAMIKYLKEGADDE